jgi:serine/threonine protein kinase
MPPSSHDIEKLRQRVNNLRNNIFPSTTTYVINNTQNGKQGGQASVRRALLGAKRLPVVIKTFKDTDIYRREVYVHITAYLRLYGPHVDPVIDPIISMPIVLSGDSNRVMAQSLLPNARDLVDYSAEGPSQQDFKQLGPLIFDALSLLHAHGIIHGDICAENIVVYTSSASRGLRVAFIDFGMGFTAEDKPLSKDDLLQKARMLTCGNSRRIDPRSDFAWMYLDIDLGDSESYYAHWHTTIKFQIEYLSKLDGYTRELNMYKRYLTQIKELQLLRAFVDWQTIPDRTAQPEPPSKRLRTE